MKKTVISFILSFVLAACFAKSNPEPTWVKNYRTVYPNSEYLVQRGSGDTAEKARTDATAALSRYFQTNVNANLSTTMSSVTTGNSISEQTVVVDEVNVQSQVEFFGLEYTEPYFNKEDKKWYCLVYMNREEAWTQYKPQIEIKKNTFNGLYKNLEKETDSFSKLNQCSKVWNAGKELLEKLEYGRIINPEKESVYEKERTLISEIPVIYEQAKQNCSIYIQLNTDYNRMISTAVSTVFSESGFTVSKNRNDASYTAEIFIDENISGSEPLSIKPVVNLKLVNKENKSVFSYEVMSGEKSIGYTLESAQKKSYPKLTKELEEGIKQKFSDFLKL